MFFFLLLLESVCHLGEVDAGLDALPPLLDLCLEISFSFLRIQSRNWINELGDKNKKYNFFFLSVNSSFYSLIFYFIWK